MLGEIFKAVMITSLVGSVFALIIILARPFTKRVFGPSWHYYIWLAVLAVMLVPVQFRLPGDNSDSAAFLAARTTYNAQRNDTIGDAAVDLTVAESAVPRAEPLKAGAQSVRLPSYDVRNIFAIAWLTGAAAIFLVNIIGYIRLLIKMRKHSVITSCPEAAAYTNRKITVRAWENISSPFIVGVFRPTLVLPAVELTAEQLNNILLHEMTHFKRRDILYKWFVAIVKCVHWFNPVVWYVTRQIGIECEISCDLSVVRQMSGEEEMSYINTILSLLSRGKSKSIPLTTGMTGSKKILKRRFIMIKNKKKTSRITSVLSAVTAAVLFSTTVFASGLLSDWAAEDYTVEITKNGENVELLNKPFIEYGSVYVPLRECMEKAGFSEANQNAYINWDNGKIDMAVVQSNGMAGIYTLEIGNYMLGLKHVEPGDIYSAESSVNDTSIAMSITMDSAPILDGAVTYVPVDDMNYMLYMFLEMPDEPRYEYSIFDKAGDDITERFNSERLAAAEAEYMAYPHNTVSYFFSDFEQREFDAMKKYCTQEFIDEFFGDGYVFGMTQAYITDMRIDPMEYAKSSNDFVITVDVNMTPHEQSVYDPSQTSTTFNITLLRQSDGRYLIDEFGR